MSCTVLQVGGFEALFPLENVEPLPVPDFREGLRATSLGFPAAEYDRKFLRLKIANAGSRLNALGIWLMQLVATVIVVELLVGRAVVPNRILAGLVILGFGYWLTVAEMRRKARADLGV